MDLTAIHISLNSFLVTSYLTKDCDTSLLTLSASSESRLSLAMMAFENSFMNSADDKLLGGNIESMEDDFELSSSTTMRGLPLILILELR